MNGCTNTQKDTHRHLSTSETQGSSCTGRRGVPVRSDEEGMCYVSRFVLCVSWKCCTHSSHVPGNTFRSTAGGAAADGVTEQGPARKMSPIFWDMTTCNLVQVSRLCSGCCLLHADFMIGVLFCPEDGGDMFLRNVRSLSPDYTSLYPTTIYRTLFICR
jgi:hypothetical protein